MRRNFILCFAFSCLCIGSRAQTEPLHLVPYVGIIHPVITYSSAETVTNFKDYYLVGFPVGINTWKSPKVGFSFEVIPHIRAEKGDSRMSNFVFHPGVLVKLGKGFTFAGRAAFETSGRYGLNPILIKTILKAKNSNAYVALPFPVRFGNNKAPSFTAAVQLGITF